MSAVPTVQTRMSEEAERMTTARETLDSELLPEFSLDLRTIL